MKREELLIEEEELVAIIDDPNLRLFDATVVLNPAAVESGHDRYLAGHIPGSVFLDHAAISEPNSNLMYTIPDEKNLGEAIGALGISRDTPVVVYSTEMLAWATRIWWVLQYAGHRNVRVLNGGLQAWKGALQIAENKYLPTTFNTDLSPQMFASKEEVLSSITEGSACVVNTLTPEMYKGEADVFYAGHISGSVNHPFFELMDEDYLLPDTTLAEILEQKMIGDRLITYCGGGIAATLNACVAKLLGVDDVAVYDGSMSEWMAEELPITTGADTGS
ncbi:MAG: rhodanese-like domain-containing protein, partial [Pseudomonadales bacterium]|nr:rhodanese-like domain-containing protein [Pseudomonadales bacterium]